MWSHSLTYKTWIKSSYYLLLFCHNITDVVRLLCLSLICLNRQNQFVMGTQSKNDSFRHLRLSESYFVGSRAAGNMSAVMQTYFTIHSSTNGKLNGNQQNVEGEKQKNWKTTYERHKKRQKTYLFYMWQF